MAPMEKRPCPTTGILNSQGEEEEESNVKYQKIMTINIFQTIINLVRMNTSHFDALEEDFNVHQTDTACSWLMCHSRADCANFIHLPRLSGGPATQFFGEASRASPQHGWRSAYSFRETLTFGCLPREWCLCWSGGRDAWQGFSREIGLSNPSTATRRRGRSTTTTGL